MIGDDILRRCLVLGLGVTGEAVTSALLQRGFAVVVVDDHPSLAKRVRAESLGVELVAAPTHEQLSALVDRSTGVLPSPGVPERHDLFGVAEKAGVPVLSELDLARAWDDRPIVAVTGTNGKTTVTTMVAEMIEAGGRHSSCVGNTDVPFVTAIDDPTIDVFVVEASSFRLAHSRGFEPHVATWLNFADDHLDVHRSLASYEQAKARIWAHLPSDATAIANADDPVVMRNVTTRDQTVTFGLAEPADFRVERDVLVTDQGDELVRLDELPRSLPHDVANSLAASATALAGGAPFEAVRSVLIGFRGLSHRVQLVLEHSGVSWYDDSKATAPHATSSAVRGFESVVLIAGGRNKGLDLSGLRDEVARIRAVVAIGEAAREVQAVFAGVRPVEIAGSMPEAVRLAAAAAKPGDAVVLSPACASFDWYGNYAERGDAFVEAVRAIVPEETAT